MSDPAAEILPGRSMYETARRALANYDDAAAEGRDDDRVLYALRMVAIVRAICDAIDVSGGWALLVTDPCPRLIGTFGSEADAREWAATGLPAGAGYTVMPIDVRAVRRPIAVRW